VRSLVWLALAALLVLPAATATAESTRVEGPALAPGDTWTYRTNTSLATGVALNGLVTLTVTGHAATEVEGRSFDAYILSVTGAGTASGTFALRSGGSTQASGAWTLSGRQIVDARGLKILFSVLDLEANGTIHTNSIPLAFQLSVQNTTSFRIDSDPWQFPLTIGATSQVARQMNFTEDFRLVYFGGGPNPSRTAGVIWWNASYSIEAATSVETPAGHFDAYPIRESEPDGTETVSFFAPVAGNHARTEARNGTTQVGTADLVSYRYQALEPPTFLGLTMDRWAFVTIGAAATTVLVVWWFCRRRKRASRDGHGVPVKEAP